MILHSLKLILIKCNGANVYRYWWSNWRIGGSVDRKIFGNCRNVKFYIHDTRINGCKEAMNTIFIDLIFFYIQRETHCATNSWKQNCTTCFAFDQMLSVLFLKAPTYETSQLVSQHNPNAFYYSFEYEGRNSMNDYSFASNPVPVPHGIYSLISLTCFLLDWKHI